ncbi:helix-turn-helix transcriptional regulator [Streptosporangium sp. CA-115845]|uniref:helix-turn-helix transcriptional regulator n=1 Tax=Streptosporangium sp. CA-115845 TaxID=3240071 RepID=UPI003D8B05BC
MGGVPHQLTAGILASLAEANVELGGQMLDTEEVAERAKIATTTLTSYVARKQAPEPDIGEGTRKPRWHETTVTAWLLTRRALPER